MKLARLPNGEPEIFHTLQGEGRSIGRPSIFIRSSFCNLYCQWCDTDYTWNWEGTPFAHARDAERVGTKYSRAEQIVERSPREIAEAVSVYPTDHFVLTGGEPLLQSKEWIDVIHEIRICKAGATFEVETNGTIFPQRALVDEIERFNVSPKLAHSGVEEKARIKPKALRSFAETDRADFKFVLSSPSDLEEIESLVETFQIPRQRVFLMPAALSPDQLDRNQSWLSDLCLEHGYRFGDRLHLRLYGAKRGV
ncbi:MAG: 7-carboxy-7-deazaguanine synthase QueE [Verrucomicrobiota bacterium]